jgi:hypothetical protein
MFVHFALMFVFAMGAAAQGEPSKSHIQAENGELVASEEEEAEGLIEQNATVRKKRPQD